MENDLKFLNSFNLIPGVGPATLWTLKNHFGNFEGAWRAPEAALVEAGLRDTALRSILWKRASLNPDKEIEQLIREGIWMVGHGDPQYPLTLNEIPSPPMSLYGRGTPHWQMDEKQNNSCFGVVGTRRPTAYGLEATYNIVSGLVDAGLTIISGMALGIDTKAHETALENNGKTIAVLGSGLDQNSIYPPENRGLMRRIIDSGGTVISEHAPGTPALKENFPQRNRIVSGLSRGILVIEAREKSGALITARLALDQNRDVFAIPGSIFTPHAKGPNKLIQEGAKLVTSASDILEDLGIEYTKERERTIQEDLGEKEKIIIQLIAEPMGVDLIKSKTGFEASAIIATLSMLELKGLVRNLGGDTYQKI